MRWSVQHQTEHIHLKYDFNNTYHVLRDGGVTLII